MKYLRLLNIFKIIKGMLDEGAKLGISMGDLIRKILLNEPSMKQTIEQIRDEVKTRVCKECEEEFELSSEYFHKGPGCIGGFRPTCKECSNKNYELKKDKKLKFNEVMADIREEQK